MLGNSIHSERLVIASLWNFFDLDFQTFPGMWRKMLVSALLGPTWWLLISRRRLSPFPFFSYDHQIQCHHDHDHQLQCHHDHLQCHHDHDHQLQCHDHDHDDQDSGKYTCELDSDDDDPLSVTHTLQILGMVMMVTGWRWWWWLGWWRWSWWCWWWWWWWCWPSNFLHPAPMLLTPPLPKLSQTCQHISQN